MEKLNQVFKALSDETRLRIINLLSFGELCVCDIMAILDISQPKASRHLAYLKHSGLVQSRRQGLWMHYSLRNDRGKNMQTLIDCIINFRREYPFLQNDVARLTKHLEEKSIHTPNC